MWPLQAISVISRRGTAIVVNHVRLRRVRLTSVLREAWIIYVHEKYGVNVESASDPRKKAELGVKRS